jgi:hypothetical protein
MKKLTSNTRLLSLTCLLGSIFLIPTILTPAPSNSLPSTTFACILQGKDYVTVARRGDRTTPPMIIWKDNTFGKKYPPQVRCKIVSQRLTKAVSSTGKLTSLDMTHGIVNSIPVICYITNKGDQCNSENILFSLKSTERGQEQEILAQLLAFSKKGTGGPITRGPGQEEDPAVGAGDMTWGDTIERKLNSPVTNTPANPNSNGE